MGVAAAVSAPDGRCCLARAGPRKVAAGMGAGKAGPEEGGLDSPHGGSCEHS